MEVIIRIVKNDGPGKAYLAEILQPDPNHADDPTRHVLIDQCEGGSPAIALANAARGVDMLAREDRELMLAEAGALDPNRTPTALLWGGLRDLEGAKS